MVLASEDLAGGTQVNRAREYNLSSRGLLEERARGFVTFATIR